MTEEINVPEEIKTEPVPEEPKPQPLTTLCEDCGKETPSAITKTAKIVCVECAKKHEVLRWLR